MRISALVSLFVAFVLAGWSVEAKKPKVQEKAVARVAIDANKGALFLATRGIYMLPMGGPECYYCKNMAGKNLDVAEMFRLVTGAPGLKPVHVCMLRGRDNWEDVERECPAFAATRNLNCRDPRSKEFWVELARREYAEGDEIEFSVIGYPSGETSFTPKPGSMAKPERMVVGVPSIPTSEILKK